MTFPLNRYKDVRSIQSLNRHAMSHAAREKFSLKNPPLLNIALDHVLLDELRTSTAAYHRCVALQYHHDDGKINGSSTQITSKI